MRGVSRPRPSKFGAPVQVRLPPELVEQLERWAEAAGLSRSQAVRAMIEKGVREPPPGKLQAAVGP